MSSKARLVITAVVVEQQPVNHVAHTYGVSRSWIYELLARYRVEGTAAFEPRPRRPRSSPRATPPEIVELVLRLRKQLREQGLDAGAETIGWHLTHHHGITVSRATIHRLLARHGEVDPEPAKRPRSSYLRFEATQPNECWQSDFTHYRLLSGEHVEVITWLDDHCRYALSVSAHRRITAAIVATTFAAAAAREGFPASTLTDNGMVYTVRLASRRGGRTALEHELARRGIVQKNSRPNHPTTCGKVERFQQTLKNWLRAQPHQPRTLPDLQALLEVFVETYNHHRPHRGPPAGINVEAVGDEPAVVVRGGQLDLVECHVRPAAWAAVCGLDEGAVRLRECEVTNAEGAGLVVTSAAASVLEASRVRGLATSGVAVAERGAVSVRGGVIGPCSGNGVFATGEARVTIEGAEVHETGKPSLAVEGNAHVVATGATVRDAEGVGVYLASAGQVELDDCVVERSGLEGVFIDAGCAPTLRGCRILASGGRGLHVVGRSAGSVSDCEVADSAGVESASETTARSRSIG